MVVDTDGVSLTQLAGQIADLRSKAQAHVHSLSHIHAQLRLLEAEMVKRQQPPEDWE